MSAMLTLLLHCRHGNICCGPHNRRYYEFLSALPCAFRHSQKYLVFKFLTYNILKYKLKTLITLRIPANMA